MGHTTDHDRHGYHKPSTLRVTVRQSESKTRTGFHDERTARKWLYVRLPPRVFHQAGLERGDIAEVSLYFKDGVGIINIRKEAWDQKVLDDE